MTSPVTVVVLFPPLLTAHPRSPKAPRKRSQHCWMLHVASVCTTCCMLLGVVTQSLKPGKLLSQELATFLLFHDRRSVEQQCWIRLHSFSDIVGARHAHYTRSPWRQQRNNFAWQANIVGNCCIRLHTTANTDATTPNIVGPTVGPNRPW